MRNPTPGLIVVCGLPGTGKSTVAALLARELGAAYVRNDSIAQALIDSGEVPDLQTAAYVVGYALARDQLRVGLTTVVDCVNPVQVTRDARRAVARDHWLLEVELVCSDTAEHRSRVEHRSADIPGLVLPTWRQVETRHYEPSDREHLVIDTADVSAERAVEIVRVRVG